MRIKDYDYARQGMYFVTVCIHNRKCLLGKIMDGEMRLNGFGDLVEHWWQKIVDHYSCAKLDEYIIMPNHMHGIIKITDNVGAGSPRPKEFSHPITLGQVVAYFKYSSTKQLNNIRKTPGVRLWQRNYYDHIIRNEEDLCRIREYVINNPILWTADEYFNE